MKSLVSSSMHLLGRGVEQLGVIALVNGDGDLPIREFIRVENVIGFSFLFLGRLSFLGLPLRRFGLVFALLLVLPFISSFSLFPDYLEAFLVMLFRLMFFLRAVALFLRLGCASFGI